MVERREVRKRGIYRIFNQYPALANLQLLRQQHGVTQLVLHLNARMTLLIDKQLPIFIS
jgi:hypothetical protein